MDISMKEHISNVLDNVFIYVLRMKETLGSVLPNQALLHLRLQKPNSQIIQKFG